MSTTDRQQTPEVAKFFSQARRIPMLIGKMPDGSKIWGGPYTVYQLIALVIAGAGLYLFHGMWSTGAILADLLVGAVIAISAALLAGQIPLDARNPTALVSSFVNALQSPRTGTYHGKAPRLRRPHRANVAISVQPLFLEADALVDGDPVTEAPAEADVAVEPDPTPTTQDEPVSPEPQSVTELPRTGLERLIAQSQKVS
ncbi:hypothetical protein [Brevibacterium renqingii]|uniref:hypothetical protein n=1 Tax=Brevibacterium renqingii TaxID=2776916 RepID=UPI001ADFE8A3|nr:hypothetical protein [Brevibacterium renqingii]